MSKGKNKEKVCKYLQMLIYTLEIMSKELHKGMDNIIGTAEHSIEENFYQV